MTVEIEGKEYFEVPSTTCYVNDYGCDFYHEECDSKLNLCSPRHGAEGRVIFLSKERYIAFIAKKLKS